MYDFMSGRSVLITGAGGSIGSGIARAVLSRAAPSALHLLDISEYNLYRLSESPEFRRTSTKVENLIGDVRHRALIQHVMEYHEVDVVIHAAALKHVPMLESPHNCLEGIRTNALGTFQVLDAAKRAGVKLVTIISTDKAVDPESVMGATKAVAEMLAEAASAHMETAVVRFGNVMASSGSVIPKFWEQIRAGGPVTVTDPNMTRYMMSVQQAVGLVLDASEFVHHRSRSGRFVLDMGEPVRILDLARQMVYLSGLDVPVKITGLRPGEKLSEQLYDPERESIDSSRVPGVFELHYRGQPPDAENVWSVVEGELQLLCDERKYSEVLELLFSLVSDDAKA